jgi:large conductance mechanosensitive channel
MREMLKEFREFILKGNAFDLAVGVIIGAAFSAVVASLVADILLPPIGALGGFDFSAYFLDLTALIKRAKGEAVTPLASLDAAKAAGHAVIAYGKFINTIINLLIVGAVIFLVVKQVNRLKREAPPKPAETPADVLLLTEIRDLLAKQQRGTGPTAPGA